MFAFITYYLETVTFNTEPYLDTFEEDKETRVKLILLVKSFVLV